MSLGLVRRASKGAPLSAGDFDGNMDKLEAAAFTADILVVSTLDDLPDPVNGVITLPSQTVVVLGDLNIGSNALQLSTGTVLRGLGNDTITSSATGGVVRATNIGSALVMREFSIIATGGPCIDLEGTTDHQLNLFFVGFFGAAVGTVTGFDVQGFKDCFFNAAAGLTLTGTTNKVFISQCPFYGLAPGGAAITLATGLNARRVDMIANFFKHDAGATPLKAEAGYTVGYGRVSGSMMQGPTDMLDGLSSADDNWFFRENDLVPDSRVAGQSSLTADATTPITTQGTFEPVTGSFTVSSLTQRLELNGTNELEYTGGDPVLITFSASFAVDPSNNDRVAFRATKNGTDLAYSQAIVEQGAGPGSSPRGGSIVALIEMVTGDRVGLAVANLDSTADVPWLAATYAVTA